jgi:hypothetical protein
MERREGTDTGVSTRPAPSAALAAAAVETAKQLRSAISAGACSLAIGAVRRPRRPMIVPREERELGSRVLL